MKDIDEVYIVHLPHRDLLNSNPWLYPSHIDSPSER